MATTGVRRSTGAAQAGQVEQPEKVEKVEKVEAKPKVEEVEPAQTQQQQQQQQPQQVQPPAAPPKPIEGTGGSGSGSGGRVGAPSAAGGSVSASGPAATGRAAAPVARGGEAAGKVSSEPAIPAAPPRALEPETARAGIASEVKATRAEATQAAGGGQPLDGRGRTVDVIDFIPDHGRKAASAVNDPNTGIAPGAKTNTTVLPSPPPQIMNDAIRTQVHDTKAWSGKQDPAAVGKTVQAAEAAYAAGKASAGDVATLHLAGMAATMASLKAGKPGEPRMLEPINGNKPAEVNGAIADMLNKPGSNPVAQAAVQAANDWARSSPESITRGVPAGVAGEVSRWSDALSQVKNPDPSKPHFVSMSVGIEPGSSANAMANASFMSPEWRQQNGLGPVGAPLTPEQQKRVGELFTERRDAIGKAAEAATARDPGVAAAVQKLDAVARQKLDQENIGTVLSTGNRGHQPGATNFLDTPNILSVGSTTDGGEPFKANDTTMASFSNEKGDIAAPGLVVAPQAANPPIPATRSMPYLFGIQDRSVTPGSNGKPVIEPGTSFATPYVAGGAALVSQAAPELSARQVLDALRTTAQPATGPYSHRAGAGVIDIPAAVKRARALQTN